MEYEKVYIIISEYTTGADTCREVEGVYISEAEAHRTCNFWNEQVKATNKNIEYSVEEHYLI